MMKYISEVLGKITVRLVQQVVVAPVLVPVALRPVPHPASRRDVDRLPPLLEPPLPALLRQPVLVLELQCNQVEQ